MPQAPLVSEAAAVRGVAASPQVRVADAQIAAAEHGRLLAQRNWYPDFNVALSPIQRGDRLDAWEAMVGINLPLQVDTRRAQEAEAQALLGAAQARREDAARRLAGELGEQVAAFNAALEQDRLLREALLPQARLAFSSALPSYESGRIDFATLLAAQRQIREAQLAVLRAQVEQRLRLAEVERLIGED
jgi:outer membrane protein TolC